MVTANRSSKAIPSITPFQSPERKKWFWSTRVWIWFNHLFAISIQLISPHKLAELSSLVPKSLLKMLASAPRKLAPSRCLSTITSLSRAVPRTLTRNYGRTTRNKLPMKPGTPLKSLGVVKDQDPPVVKPREEYPAWVGSLATPPHTLATLRRMPNEEATDRDIMRYLKLNRRQIIKKRNEQAAN